MIIAVDDQAPGEEPNLQKNFQIFKKVIPAVAKWCPRTVIVVATRPIEVMSYIAWKLSKFPADRVLGTGTFLDSVRFQYYLGEKLGLANTSVSCMSIGAQGDHSGIKFLSSHLILVLPMYLITRVSSVTLKTNSRMILGVQGRNS